MAYSSYEAAEKAFQLVTTGLLNGSIKLQGNPSNIAAQSQTVAIADAAYLSKLLANLSASIQTLVP